jgi:signal transduction histidine kinase
MNYWISRAWSWGNRWSWSAVRRTWSGLARRKVLEYDQTTDRHVFRVAAETELNLVGAGDSARLERVLDNLLGNAIKYTPDGSVITVIVVRDDDETGRWAVLSVRDTGLGIPAVDVQRIFERFQRAGNVGQIGGSGIGLAVAREVVEQHGANILVESSETFRFLSVRLSSSSSCPTVSMLARTMRARSLAEMTHLHTKRRLTHDRQDAGMPA